MTRKKKPSSKITPSPATLPSKKGKAQPSKAASSTKRPKGR